MYKNKRILAIVPARGGSQGIPHKNLLEFCGVSLVAQAGVVANMVPFFDMGICSSDDPKIQEEAYNIGKLKCLFTRPPELSDGKVGDVAVLTHALLETEKTSGVQYDVVVMLQPTSPLRTPKDIEAIITKLLDFSYDSVWTISPTNAKEHPLKQLVVNEETGVLEYYDPKGAEIRYRQELPPVYHRNGVGYALTRECLLEQKTLLGKNAAYHIIDRPIVNIDIPEDLAWAEFLKTKYGI